MRAFCVGTLSLTCRWNEQKASQAEFHCFDKIILLKFNFELIMNNKLINYTSLFFKTKFYVFVIIHNFSLDKIFINNNTQFFFCYFNLIFMFYGLPTTVKLDPIQISCMIVGC